MLILKTKLTIILIIVTLVLLPFKVNAKVANSSEDFSPLIIYVFEEDKNDACKEAEKWLEEYTKNNNLINIEYINDKEILEKVKSQYKIKTIKYPFIIIGSNYFLGFSDNTKKDLNNAIAAYENANYCNVIAKIREDNNIESCFKSNEGIYHKDHNNIILATTLLLSSLIGLIIMKKSKYFNYHIF